ncbi:MAG: peroxiredoxin [Solirubrobacterales bacterium]|nr:peroxiredoxin [Solirubrobacterales bacterium]
MTTHDPYELPADLPVPEDDGAADHLVGMPIPDVSLPSSGGGNLRLDELGSRARAIVFAYPRMSVPGSDPLVPDWDEIPGARGCTPESCGFRDLHAELAQAGADVAGVSTQSTDYQRETVDRLGLPYPMLSDLAGRLTEALRLPTFEADGNVLLRRLTLVIADGGIEHVFYPVFPPDRHAGEVLAWLRAHAASS